MTQVQEDLKQAVINAYEDLKRRVKTAKENGVEIGLAVELQDAESMTLFFSQK
jgi:hypothetical protein